MMAGSPIETRPTVKAERVDFFFDDDEMCEFRHGQHNPPSL